jgi:hypothetical protein
MDYLAGAFLIVVGLFFIPFGRRRGPRLPRQGAIPAWLDGMILWGMGLTCLSFGAALLLGRARF